MPGGDEILSVIAEISTSFMDSGRSGLDGAIVEALGRIAGLARVERIAVYTFAPDDDTHVRLTYEWCRPGLESPEPRTTSVPTTAFQHYKGLFDESHVLRIDDTSTLPMHASAEREGAAAAGAKSIAVVAVEAGEQRFGFLSFFRVDQARAWTDAEINLLRISGHLIASALLRRTSQARLEESEARSRALVDASFEGIAISVDGRIVEHNQVFAEMAGRSRDELIGMTAADFTTPEGAVMVAEHQNSRDDTPYVIDAIRKDGTTFRCEVLGRSISYQGSEARVTAFRDVTAREREQEQRRRIDQQMQHTQKLESLGVLAGGIAHDFNNLLVGILGNADLAILESEETAPVVEHLEAVKVAAKRASELTNQMLAYSGRGTFVVRSLNLNDLIRETVDLLKAAISKKAGLVLELSQDLPPVEIDPTQIRQVVMNLVTNASDALGDSTGTITLWTGLKDADRNYLGDAGLGAELDEGVYVCLQVEDTGSGMDEGTQARIFDPFFTTKENGRGLGLAAALGIVRAHGGALKIQSSPGRGTKITVLLPRASQAQDSLSDDLEASPWSGSGCILVADDEPAVLRVTTTMLRRMGFEVACAGNGREVVDLLTRNPGEYRAVLLDLTMPGLSGTEAFREIRRIQPELPVLFLSGYSRPAAVGDLLADGPAEFLKKPFEVRTLRERLRALLG